jgi:hypothetical protein
MATKKGGKKTPDKGTKKPKRKGTKVPQTGTKTARKK